MTGLNVIVPGTPVGQGRLSHVGNGRAWMTSGEDADR